MKVIFTEAELLATFGTPLTKEESDASYYSALHFLSRVTRDPDADDPER